MLTNPAKFRIQTSFVVKGLNTFDSQIFGSRELIMRESAFFIGDVKLFDPTANSPLWSKRRQGPCDLVAVDAVATKIGTAAFRVLDATTRHDLLHHSGYVSNLVVLFGPTDIECLVVDKLSRGPK